MGMGQGRRRRGQWRWREGRGCVRVASPDQTAPRVIDYVGLRVEEFVLQSRQLRVIQRKLELQGAIGHTAPLAHEGDHLIHDRNKVHPVSPLRLRRQRAPSLTAPPFPATASAEGAQLNVPPSLPGAVPVYTCRTPS